jgi:hypothetical protein
LGTSRNARAAARCEIAGVANVPVAGEHACTASGFQQRASIHGRAAQRCARRADGDRMDRPQAQGTFRAVVRQARIPAHSILRTRALSTWVETKDATGPLLSFHRHNSVGDRRFHPLRVGTAGGQLRSVSGVSEGRRSATRVRRTDSSCFIGARSTSRTLRPLSLSMRQMPTTVGPEPTALVGLRSHRSSTVNITYNPQAASAGRSGGLASAKAMARRRGRRVRTKARRPDHVCVGRTVLVARRG